MAYMQVSSKQSSGTSATYFFLDQKSGDQVINYNMYGEKYALFLLH